MVTGKQNKDEECEELAIVLKRTLIPAHPLTNFEIQSFYQNEPKCNGVYSRNSFPTKKMGHI